MPGRVDAVQPDGHSHPSDNVPSQAWLVFVEQSPPLDGNVTAPQAVSGERVPQPVSDVLTPAVSVAPPPRRVSDVQPSRQQAAVCVWPALQLGDAWQPRLPDAWPSPPPASDEQEPSLTVSVVGVSIPFQTVSVL